MCILITLTRFDRGKNMLLVIITCCYINKIIDVVMTRSLNWIEAQEVITHKCCKRTLYAQWLYKMSRVYRHTLKYTVIKYIFVSRIVFAWSIPFVRQYVNILVQILLSHSKLIKRLFKTIVNPTFQSDCVGPSNDVTKLIKNHFRLNTNDN